MKEKINIEKMIIDVFSDNKILILSIMSLFTGYWFQDVMFSRNFGKILADLPNFIKNMSFSSVLGIVFPYVVAHFLFYIDDIIQGSKFPQMELSVVNKLISNIFESIKLTKKNININELILNLKNVLDIKNIYILIITYVVPTLLVACALIYYYLSADIKTGLGAIVLVALIILVSLKLENECVKATNKHEEFVGILYDEIQDLVNNNDTVLTSNTKDKEMENMEKVSTSCSKKHEKSEFITGEVTFKLNFMSMLMMFALDGLAIKLYVDKKIESDMMVSMCLLSYTFAQYYNSSIFKLKNVMHHIGKYLELNKYFSQFEINDSAPQNKIKIINGNITFDNVQVIHDNVINPLKLNIKIKGKQITGITGEIGTGKTSILKIIAGLKNYNGNVYIDDQNINNFSHESIVDNIIYIPQHPKLFNRTIYENLSYGSSATPQEINDAMKKFKIEKFFKKFPDGILTNVGKEGSKLSGGQKQIMSLIRAIMQQKQIILLDEPTSSLDTETKTIFMNLITAIKDRTIIIVTHDKSIFEIFDEIIEL